MRDLADVSMNLQLNCLASARPSAEANKLVIAALTVYSRFFRKP